MSSSFVKDCSNASGSGNKTFIIIIGNETGNININENQLQSLLATHGADSSSQVSVMQMGAGGNANADPSTVVPSDMTIPDTSLNSVNGVQVPTLPLNFMLGGFPTSIPVEGVGGGYAELPLDADALQRLENVLHTEQARQILGEPLLDIVNDPTPNELVSQFENLMPASDSKTDTTSSNGKKKRPAPKRRSQRQMDKAEREEVEKILAENQLMLQKEREELQRIQQEQEQKENPENKSEDDDDDSDDRDDDDDSEDDSESESEADDVEKDTTYKIDNDLKIEKKSGKSSKGKGKVAAVKKVPVKKGPLSGGKGKPKGGKKGPNDSPEKEKTGKGKKSLNNTVGRVKGAGGKKGPNVGDARKGVKAISLGKKGKNIASKKITTVTTKKKVIVGNKVAPKSKGKKLTTNSNSKKTVKKNQNVKENAEKQVKKNQNPKENTEKVKKNKNVKENASKEANKNQNLQENTEEEVKKNENVKENAAKEVKENQNVQENAAKEVKENQNVEENTEKEEKENDKMKLKIDDDKEVPKVMQIKKLSVKVKKLQDTIVWNQKVTSDESSVKAQVALEEESKSIKGIESVLESGCKMNVDTIDQFDDNEVKDIKLSDPPHDQIPQSSITTTTTTVATICSTTVSPEASTAKEDTFIKKGSTSPHNVAIVKGKNIKNIKTLKSSLSNKVQNTVNNNDNTCNNSNINNNNHNHIAVSQSVKLNCRKLDTDTCDDNILSDAKSDIDSNNKCTSPILISTQNFSDEANSPISQRQADGSQARTDVKSSSSETDNTKVNSVHGMLNLICRDESVREVSKKRNKMTNEVEILNPKEVSNSDSEIVSNNNQNEVVEVTNNPKIGPKSPCLTGDIKNPSPKKKISFENELNRGTFASNKSVCNKFKKTDKKVSLYSPTIPKSLKNFKIPKSVNKRPPLINTLPDCKPYEHLKNTHFTSHNSYQSSSFDSYSSQFIPRNLNNNYYNNDNNNDNISTLNNKTFKENAHSSDSYTHVASKMSPVATDNYSKSIKNEQHFSNSNFTRQGNDESNKIKKLNDFKILKQGQNNLDSSEVKVKNINKENINKPYQETSISPNVIPLKSKTFTEKIKKMNPGETIIRRSRRPIKRKTFGDDILFLDEKTKIHRDDFEDLENEVSNEEGRISNDSDADDDEDSDNEVEDDPDRLWCICEKPHNNRFMICCDRCEDWFHGTCVGVTKSMGKQMEKDKIQWICPNCKKAERAIKGFSSPRKEVFKSMKNLPKSPEVQITNEIYSKKKDKFNDKISRKLENESKPKEKTEPRVLVYEKATGIVLSGTAAPTLNILPDWLKENPAYTTLQPAMMNSIQTDPKTGLKRISLEAFGLKPYKPKLDRSFSFQEKIDSGSLGSAKKEKNKSVKLLKHSEVLEIEKGKKAEQLEKLIKKEEGKKKKKKRLSESLSGSLSPKKEKRSSIDLSEFYSSNSHKRTPSDKNMSRSNSLSEETPPSPNTKKSSAKDFLRDAPLAKKLALKSPEVEKSLLSSKFDTLKHRDSVKNFLYEALNKRKSEVPNEFKDITEENLKLLCKEIEEQLFLTFNKDINFKYKSRYRSLIFNIKDAKNGGLFRQILSRTIPPEKLANMTSEELASKELAEWREREEKKELEAIHKHELERIALGNQYIMKSHKGEIVIDKEELGAKNKDTGTESVISLAPDASKAVDSTPDNQEDEDTINHRNHIYNPSCKICQASELQNISKEELLEAKEKLNLEIKEELKDDKERKKSTSRRESESSSSYHHHSKHRKKDRERDRSRERRHSHKSSRDKDKSDRDRHKDSREKERSKRHRHNSEDKDRSRRHRSRERRSRERDSNSSQDLSKDGKKSEDKKRRHSETRYEDRKRVESDDEKKNFVMKEELKYENDKIMEKKSNTLITNIPDLSIKFKESSSEDSKSPSQLSNDPVDSQLVLPLDILLPPLPPLPPISNMKSEPAVPVIKASENSSNRSPATPPYPVEENDIDEDDSMLSPATPPLPDDDDDRLTPPPPTLPTQKPLEDIQIPIWKGVINMPDVAKFSAAAFEVSGKALFFTGDVPSTVEVVGRISPDNVWTYIAQVKKSGSKEILVVRFQPSCEEEKVSYIALYSYLSSKKRYGVIGNCEKTVKDFYVVPLASHQPIPQVLLPLDGPGFEESRPHMLIGVIIRSKHKRIYDPLSGTWTNLVEQPSQHPSQVEKGTFDVNDERSYTPPPANVPKPPTKKMKPSSGDDENDDNDVVFTPSPISAEGTSDLPPVKEKEKLPTFKNNSKSERESMLDELNRQIERDRKELSEMQKRIDLKMEENEKKLEEKEDNVITIIDDNDQDSVVTNSDAGGLEGSQEPFVNTPLDTSKISIPSNLHEILASIKEKEKAIAEKENEIKRRLNMPEETSDTISSSKDVDLRLLLGTGKDQDLRIFTSTGVPPGQSVDQDFRSRDPRDPRMLRDNRVGSLTSEKSDQPSLSSLSDADLVSKAVEMEGGLAFNAPNPVINPVFEQRVPPEHPPSHNMMPPPGGGPPHNMGSYPPKPNPVPPNVPYPPHSLPPPPGYRPQGPYMNSGPPNGPPMSMLRGPPPPPPFISDHPQHPPGPIIPPGHPRPPVDPSCSLPYAPHRGPPSDRMPVPDSYDPDPYEEYPPYSRPPNPVDRRQHHRVESGRHHPRDGNSWDSRGNHRDSNNLWNSEESWGRRGDGNNRRGHSNKNSDRFSEDNKKRRWVEGGSGGIRQHYRDRWGDDNEERSGGDRYWRNGGDKRPRRERHWYDSTDGESGQKEIDY